MVPASLIPAGITCSRVDDRSGERAYILLQSLRTERLSSAMRPRIALLGAATRALEPGTAHCNLQFPDEKVGSTTGTTARLCEFSRACRETFAKTDGDAPLDCRRAIF